MQQVKDAVDAAKANGWEFTGITHGGSTISLRRMTEHDTPQYAMDNDWYPSPTYTTVEFLGIRFTSRTKVPKTVHGTAPCPWVGRTDRSISFKAVLELLAQPVSQSELHDRD